MIGSPGTRPAVVRLVTRLNIGGPARQALLLTRELRDEYSTVLAAGPAAPEEGELTDPAVPVEPLPLTRRISPALDAAAVWATRRLLRAHRARLVHTHMAKAGTVGRLAAATSGLAPKTVHTFHGHVLQGYFASRTERVFVQIERRLARRTDALVAVSPEIRDQLMDLGVGRPSQWHVMPVGLDLAPFLAVDGPAGTFRQEVGVPPEVPLVGVIGRLVPIKDHDTALQALVLLAGVHLAVIGDGELGSVLRQRALDLGLAGRTHFMGWRHDLPGVLSDCDVVILTSLNEGTPVAVVEALAAGRPVVATDVGGVRHVVRDGVSGLLAPPGDHQTIASKVSALLADPSWAAAMGARGRADVASRFGQDRLVADMRELYRSLLTP